MAAAIQSAGAASWNVIEWPSISVVTFSLFFCPSSGGGGGGEEATSKVFIPFGMKSGGVPVVTVSKDNSSRRSVTNNI